MKKTRKFAALLAAVMCTSSMGVINASATEYHDVENASEYTSYSKDGDAYFAAVNAAEEAGQSILRKGINDTTDTLMANARSAVVPVQLSKSIDNTPITVATWIIDITTSSDLSWTVTKHLGGTLTWNGTEYQRTAGDETYTINTDAKSITVANKCNFNIFMDGFDFSPKYGMHTVWTANDFTITKSNDAFNIGGINSGTPLTRNNDITFNIQPASANISTAKAEALGTWDNTDDTFNTPVRVGSVIFSFMGDIDHLYSNE